MLARSTLFLIGRIKVFYSKEAKNISNLIRSNSTVIRKEIRIAFESSIVGCSSELQFFRNLINELTKFLSNLSISGLNISCRCKEIHQKPIVRPTAPSSWRSCELGDLLIVIKYQLSSGDVETKSIIYQVKLAKGTSSYCDIDQDQLTLLSDWPPFEFGLNANGGPNVYHITPITVEFGSFMLEPRGAIRGQYLPPSSSYGICPYALLVRSHGPKSINISGRIYARKDSTNFFSHLAFEIGEPHSNKPVADLVDALYRHIGLHPDPPDELEGYYKEINGDGFGIIEVNVRSPENG